MRLSKCMHALRKGMNPASKLKCYPVHDCIVLLYFCQISFKALNSFTLCLSSSFNGNMDIDFLVFLLGLVVQVRFHAI